MKDENTRTSTENGMNTENLSLKIADDMDEQSDLVGPREGAAKQEASSHDVDFEGERRGEESEEFLPSGNARYSGASSIGDNTQVICNHTQVKDEFEYGSSESDESDVSYENGNNEGSVITGDNRGSLGSESRATLSTVVSRRSTVDSHIGKTIKSMGIWSRFMDQNGIWRHQDLTDFDDDDFGTFYKIRNGFVQVGFTVQAGFYTVLNNPLILFASLVAFAIVLTVGLLAVQAQATVYSNERINNAEDAAISAGSSFAKALDDAGRGPLFTISQFVKHLDTFKGLPDEIGHLGGLIDGAGVAPPLAGKEETHRDLSNTSATNPSFIEEFNSIAQGIKADAGLEKILVSLQIAPNGVVSMIYPLVNREDFEAPIYMNNTGAIGHDLLNDARRFDAARYTLSSDKPVVVGPLTLIQGDTPVVQECFIMRLAINMTGYQIPVRQEAGEIDIYESWGFAVVLLNWAEAKKKTGLNDEFIMRGMDFSLTRVDVNVNTVTLEEEITVKQIANSTNWELLGDNNSMVVTLATTNNEWTMRVGYIDGYNPKWKVGMQVLVVFASFAISILIAIILVIRKQYQDLLFNMMPPQIISKLRKGETIVQMYDNATVYFSDIVEFTTLSGVLSPLEIMQMLNEMYTEFDHLVRKHGVYKVETIGDAYLVIGGGPEEGNNSSVEGAKRVAMFALDVMKYVQDYRTKNEMQIYIRSGLASGPVVGGVIGITSPKFSLFGETVNVASRMESTSKKMRIQCSMQTYNLLRNARNVTFNLVRRTEDATEEGIYIKGKGNQKTWWINGVESS